MAFTKVNQSAIFYNYLTRKNDFLRAGFGLMSRMLACGRHGPNLTPKIGLSSVCLLKNKKSKSKANQ